MQEVRIQEGGAVLAGDLHVPPGATGLVVFAHGSGSSRFSPRNRQVAAALHGAGLGTLLMDLLTAEEERLDTRTAELRFDITLLGRRTTGAVEQMASREPLLPLGCFGASTGAAAALVAAGARPELVRAVVSRGGRPDLAGPVLGQVRAPTLLIVGSRDREVLALNEQAKSRMTCEVELQLVEGATHLFEEPGALERVAFLAGQWFGRHLRAAPSN